MVAQIWTQQSSQTKEYPIRYVGVVFGNPRSPECAGYGICRMDEDWDIPDQPPPKPTQPPKPPKPPKDVSSCLSDCCRDVAAVERVEIQEGKVSLFFRFLKSELTPEAVKKHFNATHFRIGSPILLPITLTEAFDLDPSVFGAGLYEIVETNAYFQIRLPMN